MEKKYWTAKIYRAKVRKGTVFFFPAGFTYLWMYRLPIHLLNRDGFDVVGINVKWRKGSRELDFNSLADMFAQINDYITDYTKTGSRYSVFGTSFGGVIATYVAKKNPKIKSVILNVTHGSSANLFWDYKPTRKMIQKMKSIGVNTEADLEKHTWPIESANGIEALKDRRIVCLVSLNDRVTKDNFGTVRALQKVNPKTIVRTTKLGHFMGGMKNILSRKKWIKIL